MEESIFCDHITALNKINSCGPYSDQFFRLYAAFIRKDRILDKMHIAIFKIIYMQSMTVHK